MEQQIKSKIKELNSLSISGSEFKQWLSESSLWNWVYSDFRITGQSVSKAAVADLCKGIIREDVPLSNYGYVQSCKELYLDMQSDLSMGALPDLKLFMRWMDMITDGADFRKSNPVVFEYGLIPCHFNEIKTELTEAFKRCFNSSESPITSLGKLFLDIVKIYPYDENSVDAAMVVLLYCLMRLKLPFPELSVSEGEFGELMKAYMDKGDSTPFIDMLYRCIYNRLDAVVMIAKQAKENEDN